MLLPNSHTTAFRRSMMKRSATTPTTSCRTRKRIVRSTKNCSRTRWSTPFWIRLRSTNKPYRQRISANWLRKHNNRDQFLIIEQQGEQIILLALLFFQQTRQTCFPIRMPLSCPHFSPLAITRHKNYDDTPAQNKGFFPYSLIK